MSRDTYVLRSGKLVPKSQAAPLARSSTPYVISDYLPDLVHPATGKRMDSKSRFRAETRARGLTEMGNDMRPEKRPNFEVGNLKADIAQAIRELGG